MRCLLALVAVALSAHAARAADPDLRPYYPKDSFAVLTADLKRIAASPFAKRVFGADEPFTAARKLALLLVNENPATDFVPSAELQKSVGPAANKVERVTTVVAWDDRPGSGFLGVRTVTFVEGAITEDEFASALAALAKEGGEAEKLETENRGGRKWFRMLGLSGVLARKGLFVIGQPEDLEAVLDVLSGKAKPAENKELGAAVARVKPDETPASLVVASAKLGVAVVTLSFKGDVEVRGEYQGNRDGSLAESIEELLNGSLKGLRAGDSRRSRIWAAANIKVSRKEQTVTLSGTFPAKLLADEYAKIK